MRRRGIAFALALALVVAPVAAAAPPEDAENRDLAVEVVAGMPLERATRAFTLELGAPTGRTGNFSLGLLATSDGRYRFDRIEVIGPQSPPVLAGLTSWSVGTTFNLGFEGGRPRVLALGPLQRDWEDLDGWEKFGVVLQTAAAAAAAVHFAGKLIDKVK